LMLSFTEEVFQDSRDPGPRVESSCREEPCATFVSAERLGHFPSEDEEVYGAVWAFGF
jgi:hypothetical protein